MSRYVRAPYTVISSLLEFLPEVKCTTVLVNSKPSWGVLQGSSSEQMQYQALMSERVKFKDDSG